MKGWCKMFSPLIKTREADALGDTLKLARIRLEKTSDALVKTIDEMLEATNRANRPRDGRNEARNKPDH